MTGQGEPLVYQHGGGIMEGLDFLGSLADRFRVFAPLMPGYGATDPEPLLTGPDAVARHLSGVFDALGLERAVLVGHSLGGWLAATFAARCPERVSELVLAAPLGMHVPEHPIANMMAMTPPERLTMLTNDPSIWEGRLPAGPDPAFQAARAREQESLRHFTPGPSDPELASTTSRISMPTHLLWGDADKLIPVAHAAEWQKAITGASLQTFPGAGHLIFAELPEALAAVTAFVDLCRG